MKKLNSKFIYGCIFIDQVESEFLKTQNHQPLVWFRYIDDIISIWTQLEKFLHFDKFHPNLKFTYESSRKNVTFLDVDIKLLNGQISTDLHIKVLYYLQSEKI